MNYYREAGRLAAIYNAGRRVYNSIPSLDSAVEFLGGPVHDTIFGVDDGSVPIANSQRAADDAYIRRSMGYRLNPAGLPAPSRSSRSSVGSKCLWAIVTILNSLGVVMGRYPLAVVLDLIPVLLLLVSIVEVVHAVVSPEVVVAVTLELVVAIAAVVPTSVERFPLASVLSVKLCALACAVLSNMDLFARI